MRGSWLVILVAAALPGCALFGKSDPVVSHYFTPEYEGATRAAVIPPGQPLRLGRVEGWSHLRERMVVRSAARELSYSEDRRWTERPEVYLRRALARTLFEERGVVEALSGRAVTLEVELIAFEEIEKPHRVRLQAGLLLADHQVGLLRETVTVERPVGGGDGGDPMRAVVEAYSQALHDGVTRIADRVVARLAEQAPPDGPPAAGATPPER
jgi:cholesterol transport system auxiliary component